MIFRVVCISVLLLLANKNLLNAQPTEVGNWIMYFGNQSLGKGFNWHNEVQYRNYNFVGDLQQLLLRTGVGYNLTENNHNFLAGYAYIFNRPYVDETDDRREFAEHRLYQQYIARNKLGRIHTQHRYRFEQRFLDNSDLLMRLRYFLAFNIPVNQKTMDEGAVYASIYNEIFINTEPTFFDRNRFYLAMGYAFKAALRVEAGIMWQRFEDPGIFATYQRPQFQIAIFNNLNFLHN